MIKTYIHTYTYIFDLYKRNHSPQQQNDSCSKLSLKVSKSRRTQQMKPRDADMLLHLTRTHRQGRTKPTKTQKLIPTRGTPPRRSPLHDSTHGQTCTQTTEQPHAHQGERRLRLVSLPHKVLSPNAESEQRTQGAKQCHQQAPQHPAESSSNPSQHTL